MTTNSVDRFLEALPAGAAIQVDSRAYGLRETTGYYCGRAEEMDQPTIVVETRTRHVIPVESVEAVTCAVEEPHEASERLRSAVPLRAPITVSTGTGTAVSGVFQGVTVTPEAAVALDRRSGRVTVPLGDVTAIAVERSGHAL